MSSTRDRVEQPRPGAEFSREDYSIRISRDVLDPEWDEFLAHSPNGHHEQSSLWAEVKRCYGWHALRIVARSEHRIIGGVQVLTKKIGAGLSVGYVTRGPVVSSENPEIGELILLKLHGLADQERFSYLVIVLPFDGHHFENGLLRLGFRQKPEHFHPQGVMNATLVLNLSPGLETLLEQMRRETRRILRRAEAAGIISVREGTERDVETFRDLLWSLCRRRGVEPTPPQKDFFANLWRIFRPHGFVQLFLAEIDGRPIAAVFTFSFGETVRIWKVGWRGDHAKDHPNEVLYWEVIRWAKRNGYRYFDFVQLDRNLAIALQNGDPVDWKNVIGMSYFKTNFGGIPVVFPRTYYRFYNPVARAIAAAAGSKLIESENAARFLKKLISPLRRFKHSGHS